MKTLRFMKRGKLSFSHDSFKEEKFTKKKMKNVETVEALCLRWKPALLKHGSWTRTPFNNRREIDCSLLKYQLTFEPYTGMSDLMMSIVNDVVINDITSAMITRPHVIHTMPNNLECMPRGTRSPYLQDINNTNVTNESAICKREKA